VKAHIEDLGHVIAFRKDVRDALSGAPFSPVQREEILLALTELGTNLFHHGRRGVLEVALPTPDRPLLRIQSRNLPHPSPVKPYRDDPPSGTSRGLGIGLSSVARLMDRMDVDEAGGAFLVTCEKDALESAGG
jgi:anti-sigma regulatory factor (Ser/Thr protein kinase)